MDRVLGGQDLGVGEPGTVVDADEHDLPADATFPAAAIAVDPVSDRPDAGEVLGVDVDQAARRAMLVALWRHLGLLEPP